MKIAVGSTNPTKIMPVRETFMYYFEGVEVVGTSVSSGVREQPMDENEMYEGALNRARQTMIHIPDADYGVGIEGGLAHYPFGWFERSLVVIIDRGGKIGVGSSGGVVLPDKILKKIHQGKNLEEAIDEQFGTEKIGEGIGMFGVFTKKFVTRSEGVKHGVAFALSRFLHEGLYE